MNKTSIRADLLQKRKQLNDAFIHAASLKVVSQIVASNQYQQSQHIAIYLPINGEVDLTSLLQDHHKTWYLPAIQGKDMQFQQFDSMANLSTHQFGVKQPRFIESLPAPNLDLCLLPLVAFDLLGNRIGMGGGYYDRYFADNKTTLLAGVAYGFQLIDQLPADPWDVKLHHIFTKHKLHTL